MATFVAYPQTGPRWEHLLLGLREPCNRVALVTPEAIEPAILAYYLELVGIGPWGRLARFAGGAGGRGDAHGGEGGGGGDEGVAAREYAHGDEGAVGIDERFAVAGEGVATVHVALSEDGRVQVLAAQERLDGAARFPVASPDPLFRQAARIGAQLAAQGAVGHVAVDFDEAHEPVGIDPSPAHHAHATLLALRTNAFRAVDAIP